MKDISRTYTIGRSSLKTTVAIDQDGLEKIADAVRASPEAMAALKEGFRLDQAAKQRGDIASPKPPASYVHIFKIIGAYDPRMPGTISLDIIRELKGHLLQSERSR